jgi:hypothetical protein
VKKLSVVTAAAAALVLPSTASAHLRTGTVAVDYRPRITHRPPGPFTIGVYLSDRALHLSVRRDATVVVYGYLGEAFVRVSDAGVTVDTNSPTAAATGLVPRGTPHRGWVLRSKGRSVVWHDVRTSRREWRVPIAVDGHRETIVGETQRLPRPALWPWIVLLAAIAAAGAVVVRRSTPLGLLSSAAAIVVAAAFALSTYADPGTWIAGVDELFFAAAGIGVLRWGPPVARLPSGLWLSVLGLAVGLSKGAVFLHALVLAPLPGTAMRVFVVIAVGSGLAGSVSACVAYARAG